MTQHLDGVLVVHACFTLSRAEVDDRLAEFGLTPPFWQEVGQVSTATVELSIEYSKAMALLDSLAKVSQLRFEMTLLPNRDFTGERWVWSPVLGLGSVQIDASGNHLIGESQLTALVRECSDNVLKLERRLRKLMLSDWDDEFEELREQKMSRRMRLPRVG